MSVITVRDALEEYTLLGFDTIPLKPDSKMPRCNAWQSRNPHRMWRDVSGAVNIGIRGGGESKVAILDCDEKSQPGTYENAKRWLESIGYSDYPVVQTASGIGRHIYVNFAGGLEGNYCNFTSDFGAGEFRFGPGAFVVAPPSIVDCTSYSLLQGDYQQLP